jgi:6-pyruvoyltetrahydropterin/6-carboxytetrahydropterin synthase
MSNYQSTKLIELGSCAFRQWRANPAYATSGLTRNNNRCFHVHGYQLKARFIFGCSELDERNWVTDFGSLKPLKEALNNQFDHTLCIAVDDPALPIFKQLHDANACDLRIMDGVGIEKTAEWCYNTASIFLKDVYGDRCWVESVEVFEHEANSAIYIKPNLISYSDNISLANVVTAVSTESLPEVEISKDTVTAEEPKADPTYEVKPLPDIGPKPTQVGPGKVTSGWSNPFGGTSWGV